MPLTLSLYKYHDLVMSGRARTSVISRAFFRGLEDALPSLRPFQRLCALVLASQQVPPSIAASIQLPPGIPILILFFDGGSVGGDCRIAETQLWETIRLPSSRL